MAESRHQSTQSDPAGPAQPPRWDDVDWERFVAGGEQQPPRLGRGPDLAPLFLVLDALRAGLPRELRDQFNALVRELLLTLRALIDWYLERLDGGRREPEVEDI
ncbi:MAG: hypothetical protein ACJ76V_03790, partial [Thermoleophilaceae bacterium]